MRSLWEVILRTCLLYTSDAADDLLCNLENHPVYGDKLIYDQASGNNLFLTGKPGDPLRYIIPTNPAGYESGWKFNVNRDYLLPIQTRMLGDLTGGMWEQNPGW